MRKLYALKDMIIDDLKEYADKGKIDSVSLEAIDKLAHAGKNICKIIDYCEGEEEGYSNASMPRVHMPMPVHSYGRGRYARRDSMGRYSSAGDNVEMFRKDLQDMVDEAPNQFVRQKLIEAMSEA